MRNFILNNFVLFILKDILKKILPPKVNVLLYLSLTSLQKESYKLISDEIFNSILHDDNENDEAIVEVHNLEYNYVLPNLQKLRQICTCYKEPPKVIEENDQTIINKILNSKIELNPSQLLEYSSKFQFIDIFLMTLQELYPNEKVVIVSNFTLTLDYISTLIKSRGYGYLRIDGSVTTNDRQSLVDCFNRDSDNRFIMLLSSRAGGVGINLVGGSRLIMLEPDWNPAIDHQAMSRIWREGQKKTVYIYRLVIYSFFKINFVYYYFYYWIITDVYNRLICEGKIEEAILERQKNKLALSNDMMDDTITQNDIYESEVDEISELNVKKLSNLINPEPSLSSFCNDESINNEDKVLDIVKIKFVNDVSIFFLFLFIIS